MADHHTPAAVLGHLAAKEKTDVSLVSQLCLLLWIVATSVIPLRCSGHLRLQGLCDRADLIDFEEQAVAGLFCHTLGNAFGVGDSEVITHHLNLGAGCEFGPCLPVILVKGVLNGHDCDDTN